MVVLTAADMAVEDEVPPPSKPKVVHPPDSPLADLQAAVEQWNLDHRRDLPKAHGKCPVCSYKGGFGVDKSDPRKWFCFNSDHHAVGKQHSDGWHGDMLDLEVHETGKDRIAILRRDGYLPQICGATTKSGKTCAGTELLADGRCSFHTSTKKEQERAPEPQAKAVKKPAVELRSAKDVGESDDFRKPRRTIPTPFHALNELIGGGYKSRQVVVVLGATGMGKTGLAATLAVDGAANGHVILWGLTELSDAEQVARFIAVIARQRGHSITPDDLLSLRVPVAPWLPTIGELPIYLVDIDREDAGDPFDILQAHAIEIAKVTGQVPIIFIDYLQALTQEMVDGKHGAVGRLAKRCRQLALKLDTAVVAVSSVSRAYYGIGARARKQADVEERASDWLAAAKESGDVEYAAAGVWYLDTAEETSKLTGERLARLIVAKSRQGRTGFVGLRFHGPSGLFVEAAESVEAMRPATTSAESEDVKVLDYIRKNPGRPQKSVRVLVRGMGVTKVDAAIERLIDSGKVARVEEETTNARGQRRKREVLTSVVLGTGESDE